MVLWKRFTSAAGDPGAQTGEGQEKSADEGGSSNRISVDASLAEFEAGVRNLVSDTERAYWELAFAWGNLEASNTALNSARQTWKQIHLRSDASANGEEIQEEAQAREHYYQIKIQTQSLLHELFRAENRLRYIMGLGPTDGRLIRPIDRPTGAKVGQTNGTDLCTGQQKGT